MEQAERIAISHELVRAYGADPALSWLAACAITIVAIPHILERCLTMDPEAFANWYADSYATQYDREGIQLAAMEIRWWKERRNNDG